MKHTPSTPASASSVTCREAQEMVVRGPKGRQPALEIEDIAFPAKKDGLVDCTGQQATTTSLNTTLVLGEAGGWARVGNDPGRRQQHRLLALIDAEHKEGQRTESR